MDVKRAHEIYLEKCRVATLASIARNKAADEYEAANNEFWAANAAAVKACNRYTRLIDKEAAKGGGKETDDA